METFKKQISDRLTSVGFSKDENKWSRSVMQILPGGTISINGQVMRQQDQKREIVLNVIESYEFDVTDLNNGNVDNCLMLRFEVLENNNIANEYEINLYPTEFDLFNKIIKQMFGV